MKRQMHLRERRWMRFFLIGMLGFMGWGIFSIPPGWAQEKGMKVLAREEALRIALEKNKDILKAQEYRNMVMGRYVEERSAALPQFQLSGGYSRDRDDATKEVFRDLFPAEKGTWGAEVGVSQVLYSFGRVGAAIRAAKIGLATAEDQLKIFQQAAWRDVSSSFDDVLLAKEIYALAVQNFDQKVRIQDETHRKHTAGVATDYDVLAADVAVENARPEVIRRENQIRVTREKLRFLLGLEGEEVDAKGTFEETIAPYPSYENGVDTAWKSRPDLSDLQKRIGIAVELVKIYDAGDKPRVDLKGSYGYRDINYFDVSRGDGQVWSAGVFLTFPFFDGMRSRGKTTQAKSDLSTLKIDEAKLKDSIALQVRDALNACREAEEIVKALSGTVRQAEKLLSMAEKGYEYGVKTKLDVDDAQLSVIQAKGNLARARRDYSVARVTLDWVLGTVGAKTNK